MKKKNDNELIIPSLRVGFRNKEVFNTVKGLVDNGLYPKVFYSLMYKITKEPELLMLKQSSTDYKISKTISGLEAITKMLAEMNNDQGHLKNQITESVKIMERMTEEIIKVRDQNKIQQETLTETLEILSASSEGLAILKQLNEKTQINLTEVISRTSYDDKAVEEINTKVNELKEDRLVFGFRENDNIEFDDLDGDDLLGSDFSEDEMSDIIRTFKSEWYKW